MSTKPNSPYTPVEDLPEPRKRPGRHGGYRQPAPDKLCTYVTPEGTPCRAGRMRNSNYCIGHDQQWRENYKAAVMARGQLARSEDACTVEGLFQLIRGTIEAVQEGRIAPNVANSVAYQAQILLTHVSALERERKAHDPDDVPMVDIRSEFTRISADAVLNRHEEEVRRLGNLAFPADAAKNHIAELRRQAADILRQQPDDGARNDAHPRQAKQEGAGDAEDS
jgi:hypothetical protein